MSAQDVSSGDRPRAGFQDVLVTVSNRPYAELIPFGIFDAVVSSDDTELSMGGGVSAELARLGGPEFVAQVRWQAPARVGDVVTTSAGAMPVRHVLHAVTVDWSTSVRPTERSVRQFAREIFARSESLEAERILVPLIGSGVANFPKEASATILFEVLVQHLLSPSVLRHVALSVPDRAAHEACVELLPKLLERGGGRSRIDLVFRRGASTEGQPAIGTVMHQGPGDRTEAPAASSVLRPVRRPMAPQPKASRGASISGLGALWRRLFPARALRDEVKTPPDATELEEIAVGRPGRAPETASPSRSPTLPDASRHTRAQKLQSVPEHARPVLARRYVLLEELGRGGFGVVHLSWDLVLRRVVAIKQLRADRSFTDLLRREAAIALELTHESIVRTHHFEPETGDSGAFIVMEYVPWPTAERWLANGGDQLPPARVVAEVGIRACGALEYAHSRQVLHLDLKPANLFVDVSAEQVKLADFGLARVSSLAGRVLPEVPSGTPAYMAPEQRTHGVRLTPSTDLYQLAATLWDLLLGEVPGPGEAPPRGLEESRLRVLEAIRPALSPDAAGRPSSAIRFRELLAASL